MEKLDPEARQLAETFQYLILQRGCGALKQISCVFRKMDIDYSKKICLEEMEQGVESLGFCLSRPDMAKLFTALDRDRNGQIDFKEFMDLLTPPMKDARVKVINEAFNKLDINGDNEIKLDELKGECSSVLLIIRVVRMKGEGAWDRDVGHWIAS